jgi:hypothetical protein
MTERSQKINLQDSRLHVDGVLLNLLGALTNQTPVQILGFLYSVAQDIYSCPSNIYSVTPGKRAIATSHHYNKALVFRGYYPETDIPFKMTLFVLPTNNEDYIKLSGTVRIVESSKCVNMSFSDILNQTAAEALLDEQSGLKIDWPRTMTPTGATALPRSKKKKTKKKV